MENEGVSRIVTTNEKAKQAMDELSRIAPLSPKSSEELEQEGWTHVASYHEFLGNGAVDTDDVRQVLEIIGNETGAPGDYDFVRAFIAELKDKKRSEYDRMRNILKKATPQREEWNKNH